jgi:hypothetical protein
VNRFILSENGNGCRVTRRSLVPELEERRCGVAKLRSIGDRREALMVGIGGGSFRVCGGVEGFLLEVEDGVLRV